MEDVDFGDFSLFAEFEKEKEQRSSFIQSGNSSNYKNQSDISKNGNDSCEKSSGDTTNGEEESPGQRKLDNSRSEVFKTDNHNPDSFRRLIQPAEPLQQGPAVQVLFTDSKFSRLYRAEIESFISNLISSEKEEESSLGKITTKNCVKLKQTGEEGNTVIGCSHFYRDFCVDILGWPLVSLTPALTDSWELPVYEQAFSECLPYDEEDNSAAPKPSASCFNCDGPHNLSECKEEKNFAKIAKKRREFQAQRAASGNRYHIETDPRFANLKPGVYSEDLRKALGMQSNQLPLFIYQMRNLGYPPGYLQEAQLVKSGIAMFDKHGKEVDIDGDTMEEGEVNEYNDTNDVQYDASKIIDYPGFNVPLGENDIDQHRELRFPPMQVSHSKEVFEQFINHKKQLKEERGMKRQHAASVKENVKRSRMQSDMELGGSDEESLPATPRVFRPPLPVETPPRTPMAPPLPVDTPPRTPRTPLNPPLPVGTPIVTPTPPPLPKSTPPPTPKDLPKFMLGDEDSPNSPEGMDSQDDAETTKAIPLDTVDSESDSGSKPPSRSLSTTDLEEERILLLKQLEQIGDEDSQESQTSGISNSNDVNDSQLFTTPTTNRSMSVALGTPVGESPSDLPSFDKFAVGIADHIPYENLPNATGTYNKLQSVLKGIRSKKSE